MQSTGEAQAKRGWGVVVPPDLHCNARTEGGWLLVHNGLFEEALLRLPQHEALQHARTLRSHVDG